MGRTETLPDDLNPKFTRQFVMDFFFEEVQKLRFRVFDRDSKSENLSSHDFIGLVETSLGAIMGRRGKVQFCMRFMTG